MMFDLPQLRAGSLTEWSVGQGFVTIGVVDPLRDTLQGHERQQDKHKYQQFFRHEIPSSERSPCPDLEDRVGPQRVVGERSQRSSHPGGGAAAWLGQLRPTTHFASCTGRWSRRTPSCCRVFPCTWCWLDRRACGRSSRRRKVRS